MLSNLKGLNAFRAVMESGSLTDAARRLEITQPAVSRLIANLEEETCLTLFKRQRQRLVPTPEAEAFYREAVRVLSAWEQIPKLAQDIKARQGSQIRVVSIPRLATGILPDILQTFSVRYPDSELNVDVFSRRDLEKWSHTQQFDLGLVNLPIQNPVIECVPIFAVRAVIAMSRDHPLSNRKTVELRELLEESFVAPAEGTIMREHLDKVFMSIGCRPNIRMETSSSIFAARLATHGFGVNLIDPFTAQWVGGDKMAMVELEPTYEISFGYIYHLSHPPNVATSQFIEVMKEITPNILDRTGVPYRLLAGAERDLAVAE